MSAPTGLHPGAARLVAANLADIIRPLPPIRVSDWAAQNVVLVDGPRAGQLWSPEGAPYLVDILDCLSEDHPCNLVTVRKSQQTGASIAALAWVLYCAAREPANMLYALPGIDALRDLNSGKLQPLIDAAQRRTGQRLVLPQLSRSGAGSTSYEKVFARGGRIWLANANSVMDLSSKTIKKGVKDEVSKWAPIPGAQDPEDLFFGRFTAFRASGDWKILEISTPEFDTGDALGEAAGHCRVDRSFKRSDQRYWHIACPECRAVQYQRIEQFIIDERSPHKSRYCCEGCGHEIGESERRLALRPENGAAWVATKPGPDRHPGFHIDGFASLMMSYEAIAEEALKAKASEIADKGFHNLVLGLPFAFRGDAPAHTMLMERREEGMARGHVPAEALLVTAYADVQMRGVWLEIVGWGADRRSWLIDAMHLPGETDRPDAPVFQRLAEMTLSRRLPDAFGGERRIDALGVDTGYRQHIVAEWVRQNQGVHPETGLELIYAMKGEDGWGKPPVGMPKLIDINLDGRRIAQGCRQWMVGTWPLKAQVYSFLRKTRAASDFGDIPPGYCHFPAWADEEYFQQLTAEALVDTTTRGVATGKRWTPIRRDNHFLDCRAGNLALFEHLTARASAADWEALRMLRGVSPAAREENLFTAAASPDPRLAAPAPSPPRETPSAGDWLGGRGQNWR
jgi:phage terminase large subunit GpA-like protein